MLLSLSQKAPASVQMHKTEYEVPSREQRQSKKRNSPFLNARMGAEWVTEFIADKAIILLLFKNFEMATKTFDGKPLEKGDIIKATLASVR